MKFNPEEISLCKQVAEKHRKKIGEGDWYISEDSDYKTGRSIPMLNDGDYEPVKAKLVGIFDDKDRNDVPLWAISDCLEFLMERGFQTFLIMELAKGWGCDGYIGDKIYEGTGNTILEACLKAILAVLEEKS